MRNAENGRYGVCVHAYATVCGGGVGEGPGVPVKAGWAWEKLFVQPPFTPIMGLCCPKLPLLGLGACGRKFGRPGNPL